MDKYGYVYMRVYAFIDFVSSFPLKNISVLFFSSLSRVKEIKSAVFLVQSTTWC